MRICASRLRCRGRRTPIDGSTGIIRSRTAARNTDRTLTNRVLMVEAARVPFIILTQCSTWLVLILFSSSSANVVHRTARPIARCVFEVQTWRCAHWA